MNSQKTPHTVPLMGELWCGFYQFLLEKTLRDIESTLYIESALLFYHDRKK